MKGLFFLVLVLAAGCSFKSQKEAQTATQSQSEFKVREGDLDHDGDGVDNLTELERGTSPFVADVPELRVRFLQNFKITLKDVKKIETGVISSPSIDTSIRKDDTEFKYRVGDVFIRNETASISAKNGRFSSHNTGEIQEHDLSWVSYPEIDPRLFTRWQSDFKKYYNEKNYQLNSTTISLENSVQLEGLGKFKSISNLVVNFYYFNYEKESYELLATKKIERHFNTGVKETFKVEIENAPEKLVSENFLKRGEFIVSEIEDYEIPELGTTYKQLMSSIKEKTVPVVFNTPLESALYYVTVGLNGVDFQTILSKVFSKNFTVEKDTLVRIGQFSNNLPDFTYLKEVSEQDKKGKWFILTNQITQNYLDYLFTPRDIVSISYLTGAELASQSSEKIVGVRELLTSVEDGTLYPLGQISPNSRVDFEVTPIEVFGDKVETHNGGTSSGGRCGKNCIQRDFICDIVANIFSPLKDSFGFKQELEGEIEQLSLVINGEEFPLKELLKKRKVEGTFVGGKLHVTIKNISSIKSITQFQENVLFLSLTTSKNSMFNGIKLLPGRGPDAALFCPDFALSMAFARGLPISTESFQWNTLARQRGKVEIGFPKIVTKNISVSVASIVNNFYN